MKKNLGIITLLYLLLMGCCKKVEDAVTPKNPTDSNVNSKIIDMSKENIKMFCDLSGGTLGDIYTMSFTSGVLKGQNVSFFNLKQGDNILKDSWRITTTGFDYAKDAYVLYSDSKQGNGSVSGTVKLSGKKITGTNIICFGDYDKTIKTVINNINGTCN